MGQKLKQRSGPTQWLHTEMRLRFVATSQELLSVTSENKR